MRKAHYCKFCGGTGDCSILFVCSSGGHLLQLLRIEDLFPETNKLWVTFNKPDARYLLANRSTLWCYHPTTRNIKNLFRNTLQAIRVLIRERPKVIVSSGAAVALPYAFIGKILGAQIVFIEAFNRVNTKSQSGRLIYPIADLFCVQWESMLKLYPRAVCIGRLP